MVLGDHGDDNTVDYRSVCHHPAGCRDIVALNAEHLTYCTVYMLLCE